MPTPEQLLQAARNTVQRPRNHAPVVHQALQNTRNKKPAALAEANGLVDNASSQQYDTKPG